VHPGMIMRIEKCSSQIIVIVLLILIIIWTCWQCIVVPEFHWSLASSRLYVGQGFNIFLHSLTRKSLEVKYRLEVPDDGLRR